MASKTTVTLPAGTVLTTTKSITVQGHTIEANATVTLGSSVTAEVGARPDQGLPSGGGGSGGGSGGSPDQSLPGAQPGVDNELPGSSGPGAQPKR